MIEVYSDRSSAVLESRLHRNSTGHVVGTVLIRDQEDNVEGEHDKIDEEE